MKLPFYKHIFLKMLFLMLVNQAFAQQTFVQGFERTSNDNWNFTATPNTYNVTAGNADDFWTDTTATNQISPSTGNRFWYMLDLENPSGGGAFFHTLDFAPIDVSAFTNNTLTFKFYTIGYEAADSIGYILETDNGLTWDFSKYVDLDRNTQAWTLVEIPVPPGAQFVRLRLMAKQNGGSDYAGFDDVQLVSANGDIVAPVVTSANVLNSTSIQLVFSEPLDATADNTSNYTGVANLSTAQRQANGDTVILTFSAPFVNGQSNTLSINGVQDLAGNANVAYDFSFIFNNSTPNLVITEINYNPPSTDPDLLEFIEIYNNGSQAAELGGLQLGGLVSLTLPALSLPAGGTFLAAAYKAECEAFFVGQTFYQWNSSTALTNGGNTLVIRNSVGVTLDSVQYDDASPWPLEPDGLGPSAELLSPNLDNNDGANWIASTTATADSSIFASPGIVNIITLPTIGFAATRSLVQENAGSATIQVNINNMNVPFAEAKLRVVSASTAVATEDYVLLDTVVTFLQIAPDPFLVNVTLLDDNDLRNSRYLILELTDFVASAPGSIREHNLMINDDDTPAPQAQANAPISISHLSSFSIDATTDATAEISAYDPASKRLFTTNIEQNKLEIIDLKNPVALAKIASIDISAYGGGINSVAISNGVVAVAVDDTLITNPGKIVFFDTDGVFVNQVIVGALPDHVNFTPDGTKLLVANEGEPATDYSVDPEGSVSVIDMTPGAAALTQANVTNIGFTQFDADTIALRAAGVRIFGPTQSVAQNIEPEFITSSDDGKTAWVTLQEANAVAIIDLENNVATAIVPLGLKDWSNYSLTHPIKPLVFSSITGT
ncbi:MAG: lamin tail domain-containing protein [Lewinellaceae bacterium]|nr:lamin tail domain-containing protein [Lewinellaceae bacterium]